MSLLDNYFFIFWKLWQLWLLCKRTPCHPVFSVCNFTHNWQIRHHFYDYGLNLIPLSPITCYLFTALGDFGLLLCTITVCHPLKNNSPLAYFYQYFHESLPLPCFHKEIVLNSVLGNIFHLNQSHYSPPWKGVSGVVLRLDSLRKLRLFLCHRKNIFLYFFTELKNLPSSLFYLQTWCYQHHWS